MSSNDLTQVRGYIKSRVLAVKPSYTEWTDSLEDIGNIPTTKLDSIFHIALGDLSSTPLTDKHVEDTQSVVLTIFKNAYNRQVDSRDELIQLANCFRLDIISPMNVENYKFANDGNIEAVEGVRISSSEIEDTNDNIIKVEVELSVRLFIGF